MLSPRNTTSNDRNNDSDRIDAWYSRICGTIMHPATAATASQVLRVVRTISRPMNARAAEKMIGCAMIAPRAPVKVRKNG